MDAQSLQFLSRLRAGQKKKPSGLFAHFHLIKAAWEAGHGVPEIVAGLKEDGVTDGLSFPNVYGFIERQQKKGAIGKKGCRKNEFHRALEVAQLSDQKPQRPSHSRKKKENPPGFLKENQVSDPEKKTSRFPKKSIAPGVEKTSITTALASNEESVELPATGPIAEDIWQAYATQEAFPLDSSGNIDWENYARQLGVESVKSLDESDYQRLAGFVMSWRTHPERAVSQTWFAGVGERAQKIRRQMLKAVNSV